MAKPDFKQQIPEQFEPKLWLNQIAKNYDLEEFKTLCFKLGINFDNLRGEGKIAKTRELILFCIRKNKVPKLVAILRNERPHISWPNAETLLEKISFFEEAESNTSGINIGKVGNNATIAQHSDVSIYNKFFGGAWKLFILAIIAILALIVVALFANNRYQFFQINPPFSQGSFTPTPVKTIIRPTELALAIVQSTPTPFNLATSTSVVLSTSTLLSNPTPFSTSTQVIISPTATPKPQLNPPPTIVTSLPQPTLLPIQTSTPQIISTSTNTAEPTNTIIPSATPTETIMPSTTPSTTPTPTSTPSLVPTIMPTLTPTATPNFGANSIIFRTYTQLGDNVGSTENEYDTGVSVEAFDCGVVGFKAEGGDINENGAGDIILVYLYPKNSTWYIRADFRTHNDKENWTVHTICVDKTFSNNYEFAQLSNLGNNTSKSLQIKNDDYNCAVIGMAAENGDIDENGTQDMFNVQVSKGLVNWELEYDFNSHGDHENWTIDVICFDTIQPQWFVAKEFNGIGDKVDKNTGISSSEFVCGISGFAANDGDIQENGSEGDLIRAFLENKNGSWWIRADFRSHYTDENWDVNVLCFSWEIAVDYGQVN